MFSSNFPVSYPQENESMGTGSADWNRQPSDSVPWGVYSQPGVTRFSGKQNLNFNRQTEAPSLELTLWNSPDNSWIDKQNFDFVKPAKRKGEELTDSLLRKQFITEEKMAAHLSQLRISSTTPAVAATPSKPEVQDNPPLLEALKVGPETKLVLSNELKKLHQESSIPQSILDSLTKPTMAVVLWQPRNQVHLLAGSSQSDDSTAQPAAEREVEPQNNNAEFEIAEDDSNNNEPINDFNLDQANLQNSLEPIDLDMDEDL